MNQLNKIPGILLSLIVAYIGIYFSHFFGQALGFEKSPISPIILSILLGIFIGNVTKLSDKFIPGLDFSTKRLLRLGIILLGIRLSFLDIVYHASVVLPLIVGCILITLLATYYLSKKLNIGLKFSLLTAIGTAICGATAIVATAPVIRSSKEETTYAIANITLFGILAMLFYPILGNLIFDDPNHIGYFLGTAIHETSQVAGAGLIYQQQYQDSIPLDIATITKLMRNSLLLVLVPTIAFINQKKDNSNFEKVSLVRLFPYFIIGFLLASLIRTVGDSSVASTGSFLNMDGDAWKFIIKEIKFAAELCLTVAMSAIGLNTNFRSLIALGLKPLYLGMIVALITGITSLLIIHFSIWINFY